MYAAKWTVSSSTALSLFFFGFLAAGGCMTADVLKLLTKPAEVPLSAAGCMSADRLNFKLAKPALLRAALPGALSGGLLCGAVAAGALLLLLPTAGGLGASWRRALLLGGAVGDCRGPARHGRCIQ
jgi:hypothetical protein